MKSIFDTKPAKAEAKVEKDATFHRPARSDNSALARQEAVNANEPPEAKVPAKAAEADARPAGEVVQPAGSMKPFDAKAAEADTRPAAEVRTADIEAARKLVAEADAEEQKSQKAANIKGSTRSFPDVKPRNNQIVLARQKGRLGGEMFLAQYREDTKKLPTGAFYSNRNGSYSVFEGTVEAWTEAPEM